MIQARGPVRVRIGPLNLKPNKAPTIMIPKKHFAGRAVAKRGVYFGGVFRPAGSVFACSAQDFRLVAETGRAEEFDPENEAHAAALKKAQAAAKSAEDKADKK